MIQETPRDQMDDQEDMFLAESNNVDKKLMARST